MKKEGEYEHHHHLHIRKEGYNPKYKEIKL